MNRSDKFLVVLVLVVSLVLYLSMQWFVTSSTGQNTVAVVTYKDKEVLRIDMAINKNYTVKGTLGDVLIEVKDKAIRVEKETSPYHLCWLQGWVQYAHVPIVCLPNHIVIIIQNAETGGEDTTVQ
ncbi:MAG: NusG domain II-containing protein [Erysipelotrichales bacterium]|nr:MAG: NusG domain II-containing protein [Erysipelotrichales bacterium]